MIQGSRGATVLVGMPGFVVGAQELVAGELWLYVETTVDVVGCPGCGSRATGHGRACTAVRDLPIAGRPTVLMWAKRRWSCCAADCEVNTFSEMSEAIAARAVLTQRARKRLADMVNVDGDSIAAAACFGVGRHTANVALATRARPQAMADGRVAAQHVPIWRTACAVRYRARSSDLCAYFCGIAWAFAFDSPDFVIGAPSQLAFN